MKVMMIADASSIHTTRILDWHLAAGCDVTFVDYQDPRPAGAGRYQFRPYPGVRAWRYLRRALGHAAAGWINAPVAARGLREIWRATRPDLVHLYQIDVRAYHCYLAGIRPLVLSSWGTDINQHFAPQAHRAYRRRTARALAAADLVIADADDVLDKCVQLAGRDVPTERLVLGINTELFRPASRAAVQAWRARLSIPDEARMLLSIRALTPLYGHHQVLDAFAQARPQFTRPAVLIFKAYNDQRGATYEQRLRHQAGQLGVAADVRWMPGVAFEELPALYGAADLIVNYPAIDGFPVSFLEAAACERPVLSNRLPAYAGTFADDYFQLVEPGNPATLVSALVRAVNTPTPTETRLHAAREVVVREYSESMVAARLMAAYSRVVARFVKSTGGPESVPSPARAIR